MPVSLRAFAAGGGGFATTVCRVRYNGGMPLYRDAFVPSDFGTAISGTPLFRMPLYRATHCTPEYWYREYLVPCTLYVFLPDIDGVFLPCDHGLDFDI